MGAPKHERQQGVDVWFPRFFSAPGLLKAWDGLAMALGAWPRLRRLKREGRLDLIDAHFAYPDGYAATLLGRWLDVPVTITLRGTEVRHSADPSLQGMIRKALRQAHRVFAVSESLRQVAVRLGIGAEKVLVVGNGVDLQKFSPMLRDDARRALNLPSEAPVLVTVGALVERKGFHRVMEVLPALRARFPSLLYLVVGGPSPEGDMSAALRRQVQELGLEEAVHFLGPLPPEQLRVPLSAANLFVLPTRNEGWANVLLEAMGCGLPVVATDVGGNAEVISSADLGVVVPFGESAALQQAIEDSLCRAWAVSAIRDYAERNTWDQRVETLLRELKAACSVMRKGRGPLVGAEHA